MIWLFYSIPTKRSQNTLVRRLNAVTLPEAMSEAKAFLKSVEAPTEIYIQFDYTIEKIPVVLGGINLIHDPTSRST